MSLVPQVSVEPYAAIRFCVRNQGTRTWFEYKIDLMNKKDNGLKDMSDGIADRRNKFAFLVFKKLKEETGSWLGRNGGSQHSADIKDIHDQACKLKDAIRREHHLSDKRAGEYEKQIPAICVSVGYNSVHITSDDWFDAVVGKAYPGTDVDHLYDKIKKRFGMFGYMVYCKLGREIKNTLLDVEKAFFADRWLSAVKTNFDQMATVPTLELKRWVGRVGTKTDTNNKPNPDYIPGMHALADWDLTMSGPFAQTYATKTFHEGSMVKVLGVENQPRHPGTNPNTGKNYDADIWLGCDGKEIPVQVGVREGELARKVSDATVCPGEEIQPNEAVSEFGGTNMDYGKKPDFDALCKKLGQIPPGGVVLWVSFKELLPGSNPIPLKEWYGEMMDKKCVIVWFDDGKAVIHHNDTEFDLTLARKLCTALGIAEPDEQTDSEYSLTEGYAPDDVEGALSHLAYMSEYLGRCSASVFVLADHLVPILRHVVKAYEKSDRENADDEGKWKHYVEEALSMLENVAKSDDVKLDPGVWVEICHILQDIAVKRHDDNPCEMLSYDEIYSRLHLKALFCLAHMVVYKLRDRTPPEVRETLTNTMRLDGQEGKEHRFVLGEALALGLRQAIPGWYAENESLLFGEDSPDGMDSVLMRSYSRACEFVRPNDLARILLDAQTMEKYHALVLTALDEEIQDVRRHESEIENQVLAPPLMKYFVHHTLNGSHGYGIEDSVRDLARIGSDAVSIAGHECGQFIHDKNTKEELIDHGVQFWETVLDLSPKPAALYGFGWWAWVESIDRDRWEQLMLRTCKAAGGLVEGPADVFRRASCDGNPTESGIRIIELVLRADRHLLADLAVSHTLSRMLENGVSIDIS